MKRKNAAICVVVCSLLVSACATDGGPSNNQLIGGGTGAVVGGFAGRLIGGNNTGMIVGALAGAAAGSLFGSWLDEREKASMTTASREAAATAKTGEKIQWSAAPAAAPSADTTQAKTKTVSTASKANSASGWVIPTTDPYVASNGKTCRNLHQVAIKNGETKEQDVTSCQSADGWSIPGAA